MRTEDSKLVLKIQIRPNGPKGEGIFLKKWKENNISTPHMVEDGYIGEHYYILMDHIDSSISKDDNLDKSFFHEMGKLLRQMHNVNSSGFGKLKDDNSAEYETFESWIKEDKQTNK